VFCHVYFIILGKQIKVLHVIPKDEVREVCGLAVIDDHLFVLRSPSRQRIEVYETSQFELRHTIRVPQIGNDTYRLTGGKIKDKKMLYISDSQASKVHLLSLDSLNLEIAVITVAEVNVEGYPMGMSINNEGNLVVACCQSDLIRVCYDRPNQPIDVKLDDVGLGLPVYAIQLAGGQFIVSHHKPDYCITKITTVRDGYGVVCQSDRASIGQPLKCPEEFIVDEEGYVLVADTGNNRLVMFDSELKCVQPKSLPFKVDGPSFLHLDQSRGHLYVGERGGGRVFVLTNVHKIADLCPISPSI